MRHFSIMAIILIAGLFYQKQDCIAKQCDTTIVLPQYTINYTALDTLLDSLCKTADPSLHFFELNISKAEWERSSLITIQRFDRPVNMYNLQDCYGVIRHNDIFLYLSGLIERDLMNTSVDSVTIHTMLYEPDIMIDDSNCYFFHFDKVVLRDTKNNIIGSPEVSNNYPYEVTDIYGKTIFTTAYIQNGNKIEWECIYHASKGQKVTATLSDSILLKKGLAGMRKYIDAVYGANYVNTSVYLYYDSETDCHEIRYIGPVIDERIGDMLKSAIEKQMKQIFKQKRFNGRSIVKVVSDV
ncbi:MAG: hypothetical protein NC308_03415 [Clostridium sp.]|nr:hypothetical protein [Bacteroides sp.]MCM1197915.1 hypothetical protein [Clostridium sp.]